MYELVYKLTKYGGETQVTLEKEPIFKITFQNASSEIIDALIQDKAEADALAELISYITQLQFLILISGSSPSVYKITGTMSEVPSLATI
jgi:hypothetical protein